MPRKDKHVVRLTAADRRRLTRLTRSGKHPARAVTHARILLKADQADQVDGGPAWDDAAIAAALDCGARTVARVRKTYAESGLDGAVHRKRPTGRRFRKLDGEQEAELVAPACSAPPGGKARWTLQLLADRLVGLRVVGAVSDETVRRTLKKTTPSRGSGSSG
jgi:transposase